MIDMSDKKSGKLPGFLKPYFWDVDFEKLDLDKSRRFILNRVIDRGNTPSLRWALSIYSKDEIRELILTSRDLSRKTANFWADMLAVDKSQVPCLQKPYSPTPFGQSS
jgi:hypothetical protein